MDSPRSCVRRDGDCFRLTLEHSPERLALADERAPRPQKQGGARRDAGQRLVATYREGAVNPASSASFTVLKQNSGMVIL